MKVKSFASACKRMNPRPEMSILRARGFAAAVNTTLRHHFHETLLFGVKKSRLEKFFRAVQ